MVQIDRSWKDVTVIDDALRKAAAEWAERTAIEQGLPPKVTNPAILDEVARILELARQERAEAERARAE